jgi:pimeloyl-ACP methyl ester carboxylesterase
VRRPSLNGHRVQRVEEAFSSLPQRYLRSETQLQATYEIRFDDLDRAWQVEVSGDSCEVADSPDGKPDTVIHTDAATWLALRDGRLSGLDAFAEKRLWAEGNLDLALAFEGMFALPGDRPPRVRVHEVAAGGHQISTLSSGKGEQAVLLLHGLGGTKSSFFRTVSALAPHHTVHALDLPGFGASSKPAGAPYNAEWMAGTVLEFMDAMDIHHAHIVGNSMGGRVAIELGLLAPERVTSLSLLAPALAWRRRRPLLPFVRLLRPELAAIPHPLLAQIVREQLKHLFAEPEKIDPRLIETGTEDFCRAYRSRNARIAFYAAARNIYLDDPFGDEGLWTRLGTLRPPALFVWGDSDTLVPAAFERHVAEVLPDARQVVLKDCGHVPMIELPKRTHALIRQQISAHADLGSSLRRWARRAA